MTVTIFRLSAVPLRQQGGRRRFHAAGGLILFAPAAVLTMPVALSIPVPLLRRSAAVFSLLGVLGITVILFFVVAVTGWLILGK